MSLCEFLLLSILVYLVLDVLALWARTKGKE